MPAQSVMATQEFSALSALDRAVPDIACSELFTAFRHWSIVIPDRELQLPAFWQTEPARSLPSWWQPAAPTANSATVITGDRIFLILEPSLGYTRSPLRT